MLCTTLKRLGRTKKKAIQTSTAGEARETEEAGTSGVGGSGRELFMSGWSRIFTDSTLRIAEKRLEWVLNGIPPNAKEGYDTLLASVVIQLSVQSALLERGSLE